VTLSTLTAYTPIAERSQGTPGLWDRRFQTLHANAQQLNLDGGALSFASLAPPSGNTVSFGTYAISASTSSFIGSLVAVESVGTVQAYSGNTIMVLSHLSMNNKRIERLGEPSGVSDAATKNYVDTAAGGKLWHYADPAQYHTTSNSTVTLSILTIAAGKLVTNGDAIKVTAWGDAGSLVAGVAAFTIGVGAEGFNQMALSGGTVSWRLEGTLIRTGASALKGESYWIRNTSIISSSGVTLGPTLANVLPIWLCVFNSSGANTISANFHGLTATVLQQ